MITQLKTFQFSFIQSYFKIILLFAKVSSVVTVQMAQTGGQLATVVQDKLLGHHQPQPQPQQQTGRYKPNLPRRYLFAAGSRENYLKIGVPLYEASIKCNWNAAKAILEKKQDLVRYSITENGETALHVAASAKGDPKDVVEFVKNLVGMMKEEDLALENESFNTALYLAAAAGNVETVKIMVEKNRSLPTIPGAKQTMMPLYAAALFGNYDVVKYLYACSKDLCDDGWDSKNRGWLLEKCVENDMFDVALKIVKEYPELGRRGSALRVLARKPEAFRDTKSNNIGTTIKSVFGFIGLKVGAPEKESTALTLLRFIWEDIAKRPKNEIDLVLRGPPDSIEQDNETVSRWAIQAMQLQKLIYEHVAKMKEETKNISIGPRDSINQNTKQEQLVRLQNLISQRLVNIHAETLNIIKGPHDSIKQDDKPVSGKGDLVLKLQNLIFEHIANMHDKTQNTIETIKMEDQALVLQQIIIEQIKKMEIEIKKILTQPRPAKETHSSRMAHTGVQPDSVLEDNHQPQQQEEEESNSIPMAQKDVHSTSLVEDSHQPHQQEEEINCIPMTNQAGVQLPSIDEENPLSQQQQQRQINSNSGQPQPNLPLSKLFEGSRKDYIRIGVPLYEASIKCDWKAAKTIIDNHQDMELVRCSITENGETALHVAASAKGPKHVDEFVKNLVDKMDKPDLELQNKNHNTALSLAAAAAGNIKAVKTMVEKNPALLTIAGSKGAMMPLYMAALFGNEDVVKYLYNNSKELRDDGWTDQNRGWLLEKCVENNIYVPHKAAIKSLSDVALKIVKTYPNLPKDSILRELARKPESFPETKINMISRTIGWGKRFYSKMLTRHQPSQNEHPEVGSENGPTESLRTEPPFPERKSNIIKRIIKSAPEKGNAFPLLRFIWEDVAQKPKLEIDEILRGPPDLIMQDSTIVSGRAIAMQRLQNLISEHVAAMNEETQKIITRHPDSTNQETVKVDQARQLQQLISERLGNLHDETQKIIKGPLIRSSKTTSQFLVREIMH
ncbi:hypothetical protein L1987_36940 [Smallanthus sonchifolius]|uniref:Uncharacterized protein n=1 Tax=Smallanthus sonchifolius TaxID=185202 RepID=A0ACB9HG87_9ASTR|nr:hypothetical protein L1987_36940 [Smallanthus sonchifolius]